MMTGKRSVAFHPGSRTDVRPMPKFLILSVVALCAAILFGFVAAAVIATNLGVAIVGAIAALVVLSGVFQTTHA